MTTTHKSVNVAKPGRTVSASQHFLGGTMGGIAGIVLAYPLDTIKVRMQTQSHPPMYRGLGHCAVTMFKNEGFSSFYKGIFSPIAGVAFIKAVAFGSNGYFQNLLKGNSDRQLSVAELALASTGSGVVTSVVVTPFERVKCAIQANRGMYKGVMDCGRTLLMKDGFMNGLYKGTGLTMLREAPSYGLYFVTYDVVKRNLAAMSPNGEVPPAMLAIAGGLSGVMCWVPIYPIDVIKSRVQASNQYAGMLDCIVRSYKQEGLGVFFRGLSATVARAIPMHATVFVTYEFTIKLLGE